MVLLPHVVEGATPLFSSFLDRNTCCMQPDFLNENTAPELTRCKQECRAFVQYSSNQACVLNATCHYAITDFDNALALAKTRLKESYVCTANYRVCNPGVSCLGGTCTDRRILHPLHVSWHCGGPCVLTTSRAASQTTSSLHTRCTWSSATTSLPTATLTLMKPYQSPSVQVRACMCMRIWFGFCAKK